MTPAVGERLSQLRSEHKWRLADVAHQSGYSVSYISDLERGRTLPSMTAISKLADVYGLSLSELLEYVGTDLSEREMAVIEAMRAGDKLRAIEIVMRV